MTANARRILIPTIFAVVAFSLGVWLLVSLSTESSSNAQPVSTGTPATFSQTPSTSLTQRPSFSGSTPIITRIPSEQWREIVETGTWRPGCPVGRKQLRLLEIGYFDFNGTERRGQLVAHRDSIDDLAEIFTQLYKDKFPIAKMEPVEKYGGDVVRSLTANNTSAFNCRKPGQINAPVRESPHANGRAIDINPVQNPWRDPRCDCWMPAAQYAKDKQGPGVIRKGSPVIRLFKERGWVWQNIKVPDYMHFDTGYPSRPRSR